MEHRRSIKLGKFLALILRHQPERFALELDGKGWASLPEIMEILHGLPNFRWATRADVMALVEEKGGDKKRRFQVDGKRIRARYGHSLAHPIHYERCIPPSILYHGTSPTALESIRQLGLRPMNRQYVHLSTDSKTAVQVGARHVDDIDERPVVLTVRAADAHTGGVEFYQADEAVYLAKCVPVEFIQFSTIQELLLR